MFFMVALLLNVFIAAASEDMLIVEAKENTTVSLNCTAKMKPGVDYRAVRWYKEGGEPRLTGLVSRTPPTGEMRWYLGADTNVSLEVDTRSLLLPPVSCKDSGIYQCYMAAPVGQQNREGRVRLSVLGCPTDPAVIPERNSDYDDYIICSFPFSNYTPKSKNQHLVIVGVVVGGLFFVAAVFCLSYRYLKKAAWQKSKNAGKGLYPDPHYPPEKQDLLWTTTVGPAPIKSGISLA